MLILILYAKLHGTFSGYLGSMDTGTDTEKSEVSIYNLKCPVVSNASQTQTELLYSISCHIES